MKDEKTLRVFDTRKEYYPQGSNFEETSRDKLQMGASVTHSKFNLWPFLMKKKGRIERK